jgi:hypothetical protein
MSNSGWALQQSIYATLASDAAVLALLGGPRIYDDVPQGAVFPFSPSVSRRFATGARAARTATSTR